MWVVLLDHSGSMGEPFHGSGTFPGRTVTGRGGTKLEEARRALYERVRGLAPSEEVVVIAFTSEASIVFEGVAGQSDELQSALDRLEATNGTNIAAAFDAAVEFLTSRGKINSRVLLVSDCKSELAPAVASADRLIKVAHVIDILLIDPDSKTEDAARAMIRLGEVQAVVSPEQLRTAVTAGDRASEQMATAIARAIEDAQHAATEVLRERARDEGKPPGTEAGFSAGYAPLLSPGRTTPLFVVIHPIEFKDEVRELISRLLSDETSDPRVATDGHTRLPSGAVVRIEPAVSGVRINPARIDLVWQDRIEHFRFTMSAEPNAVGTYALGSINVWYGPAQIGCLPISVKIVSSGATTSPTFEVSRFFRSMFPSYSRKDKSIVDRARTYYEALGIAVLQDTEALRSSAGVNWERALDGLILKADAFQLYWSRWASTSKQVEREWRFALSQSTLKGDRWIRPLRWTEDVPDLPTEIAHLQMGWLPGFEDTERPRTPAAESIRCIVMPLVDCPPEQRRTVERECCEAVHYVETVTGLRCYPPPVLLVDEFVIQQESRQPHTINYDLIVKFAAAANVLQAMSLDVHTHFTRGSLNGMPSPQVDLSLSLSDEPRRLALGLAEWVFRFMADTVLGVSGFVQPHDWGRSDGFPKEIVSQHLPPSKRLAEAVSSKNTRGSRQKEILQQDRSRLPDASIDWLRRELGDLRIEVEDDKVTVEGTEEELRAIVEHSLSPAIARAIDNANPFVVHRLDAAPPELAVFAWLAPIYFKRVAYRSDCAPFAESIGIPGWRAGLESFAIASGQEGDDPTRFVEHLLQSLQRAFDEVEKSYGPSSEFVTGYGIPSQSLEALGAEHVRIELQESGSWGHIAGTIPALKRLFTLASTTFLGILRTMRNKIQARAPSSLVDAHTYGVFIPAGLEADRHFAVWAAKNRGSELLTFPGSDRVLLCLEAIRHCIQGIDDASVRRMVRRSILIHELLHATISSAVGLDEARQAARKEARNVEESLSVWLEFDAARDCPGMRDLILEYVSSGVYPEWPYAGMSIIESTFSTGGRAAIQSLIRDLIASPKLFQSAFDDLVAKGH